MGVLGAARTLLRVQYEIVRAPMSFLDEAVLPVVFDDGRPGPVGVRARRRRRGPDGTN
ncbi:MULTISPECIES: hypothetical protein [Rhodococcus]|jgi:hypothetical protein|uniref:Uncharacterized protein n=1 Tax=Rhodococcus koreensis TaxID=99653 RepID=A0A1H4LIM2_9NOCA|nr:MULTISPECIES: hypothetical protein [Rhodococcus]SEB70376.1 hypothetical protein SAMN04490239_1300 [Rhodococcus koreensis]